MKKNLFLLFFLILAVGVVGEQIQQGGEQNSLVVERSGAWQSWMINGQELLAKPQQPFSVTDKNDGKEIEFSGRVERSGDLVHFEGRNSDLQLDVWLGYRSEYSVITVKADLLDLSGRDRAVDLNFHLVLKAGDWNFDSSWDRSAGGAIRVQTGGNYSQIDTIGPVSTSLVPWLIADNEQVGVLLAHDMSNPRFFNYSLKGRENREIEIGFSVPLGLTPKTLNFPSRADVEFVLAPFDGKEHVRGGVSRYYGIFPETFRSRFDGFPGGWGIWVEPASMDLARRCGIGFNERDITDELAMKGEESVRNVWYKSQENSLSILPYTEPWGIYIPLPNGWRKQHSKGTVLGHHELADTKALKELVNRDLGDMTISDRFHFKLTRNDVAEIINNCAIECTPEGDWCLNAYAENGFIWGVGDRIGFDSAMIVVNANPGLPRPNRNMVSWETQFAVAMEKAKEFGTELIGIYLDSELYYAGWNEVNFRQEHWRYATLPLTYVNRNGKFYLVDHMVLSNLAFLCFNRAEADRHGLAVTGNTWHPLVQYVVPFVDMVGAGEHSNKDEFVSIDDLRGFRFLAYRKLVTTMDYVLNFNGGVPVTPEGVRKYMEPRINACLMYGIFPGSGNAWADRSKVELLLPVFEPYVPLFQAINQAGWEPLTKLELDGDNADLVLRERWGDSLKDGVYFTLHNPTGEAVDVTMSLSPEDFHAAHLNSGTELISSRELPVENETDKASVSVSIPAGRTILILCR